MQAALTTSNTSDCSLPVVDTAIGTPPSIDDRLIKNRLGIYSALFLALRAKHPPTAAHCLRVALGCSKWAAMQQMSEPERELLEVAALLHDLGKLGVPDSLLQKKEVLIGGEQSLMHLHSELAVELLTSAGAAPQLLEIIRTYRYRSDTGANAFESNPSTNASQQIPLASKMIAIADAFDSMTSAQPFRQPVSRESAIDELFKYSGSQFDQGLVKEFSLLISRPTIELDALVGDRWLNQLSPYSMAGFCNSNTSIPVSSGVMQRLIDTLYHHRLLEAMSDAAIYVDHDGRILTWNLAAEKLTGRTCAAMLYQTLSSEVIGLRTVGGGNLIEERCPIGIALTSQTPVSESFLLAQVDGGKLPVSLNTLLVHNAKGEFCGAIFLMRDSSEQVELKEQVQSLHEIATTDNLTLLSNRSELSRFLPEFVASHLASSQPGSMIICDIDHFKRMNDTYGHPAGDQALVVFSQVLKQLARAGDMVARFGGEEFVLLCSNCDNATAASRAECIRQAIESTPVAALRNQHMTASFGVTEIQLGDNQETLLARADRALLMAKDSGRNRVVQLGGAIPFITEPVKKANWFGWFSSAQAKESVLEKDFITAVPQDIAIKRLSGFINDHNAEIVNVNGHHVAIRISSRQAVTHRRLNDRPIELLMEVDFQQVDVHPKGTRGSINCQTKMRVSFRAIKARDRRLANVLEQATQLLISFRSYLVANEITEDLRALIIERE